MAFNSPGPLRGLGGGGVGSKHATKEVGTPAWNIGPSHSISGSLCSFGNRLPQPCPPHDPALPSAAFAHVAPAPRLQGLTQRLAVSLGRKAATCLLPGSCSGQSPLGPFSQLGLILPQVFAVNVPPRGDPSLSHPKAAFASHRPACRLAARRPLQALAGGAPTASCPAPLPCFLHRPAPPLEGPPACVGPLTSQAGTLAARTRLPHATRSHFPTPTPAMEPKTPGPSPAGWGSPPAAALWNLQTVAPCPSLLFPGNSPEPAATLGRFTRGSSPLHPSSLGCVHGPSGN